MKTPVLLVSRILQFGTAHAPRLQCPFRCVFVSTHSTSVVANKPPESQHIALGVHWVAGLVLGLVLVTDAPEVVVNVVALVLKALVEAVVAAEVVRAVVVMAVVVVVAAVLVVTAVVVVPMLRLQLLTS